MNAAAKQVYLLIWGVCACNSGSVGYSVHARHLLTDDTAFQSSVNGCYLGLLPQQLLKRILSYLSPKILL